MKKGILFTSILTLFFVIFLTSNLFAQYTSGRVYDVYSGKDITNLQSSQLFIKRNRVLNQIGDSLKVGQMWIYETYKKVVIPEKRYYDATRKKHIKIKKRTYNEKYIMGVARYERNKFFKILGNKRVAHGSKFKDPFAFVLTKSIDEIYRMGKVKKINNKIFGK